MKKTNLKALAIALSALIAGGAIAGTIAYLTSRDTITNTFSVGNVEIKLDEAKVDLQGKPLDENGNVVEDIEDAYRHNAGNKYHLIPGQSYTKDPTMTVLKNSEESYVRMLVTINCYNALQQIYNGEFLPQYFVNGWDNNIWTTTKNIVVSGDKATYEFRYYKTVSGENSDLDLEPLFTSFIVPSEFNGSDLKALENFEITVEGNAIQKIGFDNADSAWAAFDAQTK
ncbi:MAG: hypothetical protein J6K88_02960 [Oscillospiraceae bacterium]|nr:hypothetical protein [Oscillospiraceae bacterium]